MRITYSHVLTQALRGIRGNLAALKRASTEVVSGHKVQTVSDSPLESTAILRIEARVNLYDRYKQSISLARTRMSAEEAVFNSIDDLISQAHEVISSGAPEGDGSPEARTEAIRLIRDQVLSLANTQVGSEYIFGGTLTNSPPFQSDGTYVGSSSPRQIDIGDGERLTLNQTGDMTLSSALTALDDLAEDVETGGQDTAATLARLEAIRTTVRQGQEELAGRLVLATEVESRLTQDTAALINRRQQLLEADPTESILKLTEARNSLERAYSSVSRVLSTNIFEFLK